MSSTSQKVFEKLLDFFGPQDWWPGDSSLEVMVGAVLVQNTAWKNVEHAIDNLRAADVLDTNQLLALDETELAALIRPAGYFRQKAKRLRSLMEFIVQEHAGDVTQMRDSDPAVLREQLLAVHGVGPETADAILLYALEKPAMVVDAYTHRVYARHGWVDADADYHRLQEHVVTELSAEVKLYNEFHALMVQVGKQYCRKTAPRCEACPLRDMLPESGIDSEL